jgi:ABC-type amino acid transport system permease subunit
VFDDFEEVYAEQLGPVWRFVRARIPHHGDAEDVTSEVFTRAARGWDSYDARRGSVGAWVLGIARHVVADWWRGRPPEVSWDGIDVPAVRVAAATLGLLFVAQGLGSLLAGSWVARNLDVPFDSHAFVEGGTVLVALGIVMLGGALERRWIDLAAIAGIPVGIALAAHGAPELAEFPAGGILHLSQGVAALVLGALWWRTRRYVFAPRAKRRHGH